MGSYGSCRAYSVIPPLVRRIEIETGIIGPDDLEGRPEDTLKASPIQLPRIAVLNVQLWVKFQRRGFLLPLITASFFSHDPDR